VASIVVLLAQLPPAVRETLKEVFTGQADMRVVVAENGPVEVLVAAGQTGAGVVILGMDDDDELPGIASHLLDQYPRLTILAVGADSGQVFLYQLRPQLVPLGELDSRQLLQVVRTTAGSEES